MSHDDSILEALAADVAALQRDVQAASAAARACGARISDEVSAGLITRLELKKLREHVGQLAAALTDALGRHQVKDPPAPWWDNLDPRQHAQQLTELARWVDGFLRAHYPACTATLPPCWAQHPDALWELSTLRAEWDRVYGDPQNRDLAGALWWHERWLPGTLTRLARSIPCDSGGCRLRSSPGAGNGR